jgi:hypothetical protein
MARIAPAKVQVMITLAAKLLATGAAVVISGIMLGRSGEPT